MRISLALSICVPFISTMQSVNGAKLIIIIFFLFFGFAAVPMFGTVIVPLARKYALEH